MDILGIHQIQLTILYQHSFLSRCTAAAVPWPLHRDLVLRDSSLDRQHKHQESHKTAYLTNISACPH